MAYIDDLDSASAPIRRRRPIMGGTASVSPESAAPPEISYGGSSPADPAGNPNPGYTGNTGIRPPVRVPPVVVPPPPISPASVPPPSAPAQPSQAPTGRIAPPPSGVDPAKWQSGHVSPKYAWIEASQKYDQRTPEGRAQALADVQQRYPQWFANWTIDGDKLRYGGDLNSLHGDFDGYNEFDAWQGSKVGNWGAQWLPTQRYGQAYVDPVQAQAASGSAAGGGASYGAGGSPTGGSPASGASGGSNSGTPNQGGLPLGPLSGQLGGAGGMNFGIDGEYGYDDPSTRKLEEFLRLMIDEKTNPIDDPARNDYANALRQRFQSLIAPGSGTNAGAVDLDSQLQTAIEQLTSPALTENDRSRLENRALEPMEKDRAVAIQNAIERLAAKGLGRGSGAFEQVIADINQQFDQQRGSVQRDLSIYEREQQDARRREAVDFGTQRRDVIGTELDRETGRYGQALTMAEALANLSGQQRTEQDARMREALTYTSLFPEMDERRLRLAMETLGLSNSMSNAPSIFNTLSGLSAQANAAAQQGQQSNAAFWSQMGQWMANAWPKE